MDVHLLHTDLNIKKFLPFKEVPPPWGMFVLIFLFLSMDFARGNGLKLDRFHTEANQKHLFLNKSLNWEQPI